MDTGVLSISWHLSLWVFIFLLLCRSGIVFAGCWPIGALLLLAIFRVIWIVFSSPSPPPSPHWDAAQLLRNSLILPKSILKLRVCPGRLSSLANVALQPKLQRLPSERFFWQSEKKKKSFPGFLPWLLLKSSFPSLFLPSLICRPAVTWMRVNQDCRNLFISHLPITQVASCLASLAFQLHLSHFQRHLGWE